MVTLHSSQLSLSVDEKGRIDSLSFCGGRNVIAAPTGLFRAVLQTGDNWEDVAFAKDQRCTVVQRDDRIVIKLDALHTRDGERSIALTLTIRLAGERLFFDADIENHSESTIVDFYYPCLGALDTLEGGPMDMLFPRHMGERIVNVCGYLKGLQNRESLYEISASYPNPLSMQWMLLEDGGTCLYLTGRDTLFYTGSMRAHGSAKGGVTLEMNKMAFVKPGEVWQCPQSMAWLYRGDWMRAAREYAAWAATWRKPVEPKEWIKKMNGYFLVINKQQYGDENWAYDTLPELYRYAQAHGFNALGLFGWYHSGHDNNYPDLIESPTMGGAEMLRENIRKVQAAGGHVTLYYQGHLMDVASEYYQTKGRKLEGKNRWGTPYYEFYSKFCHSDFLKCFSKKVFSTVCPSCTEWHELMAQRADWIHGFGADGILYDQIGGMPPYPCFDETHDHMLGKPSLSHAQGRIRLHKRIRRQADSYHEFAYMTEHVTDVHSQFIDCLHGIGSLPGSQGVGVSVAGIGYAGAAKSSEKNAYVVMMPEMFRYTFPETFVTIRNNFPTVSRRYANYAFLYGYKLEMEIRYATDKEYLKNDEGRENRLYVKKIADLREQYGEYLLTGRFMAQEGLTNGNPSVKAALFQNGQGRLACALWNDTDAAQTVSVSAANGCWNAWASPDGHGDGIPQTIQSEGVLLLYQKS